MNLKDKIAIVTGGGRGIGKVIAQTLAAQGVKVIAASRSKQELEVLKEEIKKNGFSIEIKAVDVSDYKQVQKLMSGVIKKFGTIDILVNAAGVYGPIGLFGDNDIKKWSEALQINLLGTVNCAHAVLPIMTKNKSGKIINFSGGGAVNSFPHFSAYATSKAAIVRFTENLAVEYKEYGIQVNAVAPGAVNTKLLEESLAAGQEAVGKDFYEKILQQKQEGGDSPQLAADLIMFFISTSLTGKLISAKWDKWKEWDKAEVERINNSQEFTLRRIDNKYFKEITK
ncbi:MAG TPA: SDR family oxidoreductase [Candidatus Udaeobacter sp.]|nr:SDR family oxidoreductase [Candidatus Udaeobacter sp.]